MVALKPEEMKTVGGMQLFQGVKANDLSALLNTAQIVGYDTGEAVFSQGDRVREVFILIDGGLENLVTDRNNRRSTFRIIHDGPLLAYPSLPGQRHHAVGCRAFIPSRVAVIDMEKFAAVLYRSPTLAEGLFMELAQVENEMTEYLADLKGRSSLQRLAGFLARQTHAQQGPADVRLPILKQNLASMMGVVPEKLSRDFAQLAGYGVVSRGRHVIIEDVQRLWRLHAVSTKATASTSHAEI